MNMVRLTDLSSDERKFLLDYDCPTIDLQGFNAGPPMAQRRVAVVTTSGLRRATDRAYAVDATDYRLLPAQRRHEFVMDHISGGHDRTGFAQDLNTVLPLDRLDELAAEGTIGGVAETHYSFMGAGNVFGMRAPVEQIVPALKAERVDTVLLSPV
jgi:D-proline reductase (dithiol) PrdB